MIVKVFNTNTYEVVKSINETHYYREIMRLKIKHSKFIISDRKAYST